MNVDEKNGREKKERILEGIFIAIVSGIAVFIITSYIFPLIVSKFGLDGTDSGSPYSSSKVESEDSKSSQNNNDANSSNTKDKVTSTDFENDLTDDGSSNNIGVSASLPKNNSKEPLKKGPI